MSEKPRWLLLPGVALLVAVFYLPLLSVFIISFATRSMQSAQLQFWPPTLANYLQLFDAVYFNVLISSLVVVGSATVVALALAFPFAWMIVQQSERMRQILLTALMLPFFANFLAKIYAWYMLLKPSGLLARWFSPLDFFTSPGIAMVIVLVSTYLPFVTFPIYFSLQRIDKRILDAAKNLGAKDSDIFWQIILPMVRPGLVAGAIMIALPALGEFLIAKMVGGGLVPQLSMVVEGAFLGKVTPNWPFGAALSMVLMAAVCVAVWVLHHTDTSDGEGLF